ncbi:MAG: VWA domain-containing protein [Betaproteobacteria bacterium]|nr:VWA domain-containing protein [Betaproteobacteria bacterium]
MLVAALAWFAAGCGPQASHSQAIYMLVDTSGTYAKEVGKAELVIRYILGNLNPGDTFAVGRVKSRSFSEKDIVAKVSLSKDPLQANAQKKAFSEQIAKFSKATSGNQGSRYTDITGGVLQAAEFLNEAGARRKTIVIFSDMQEDLDQQTVRDFPIKLNGIGLVALNVTKLSADNMDPRRYLERIERWERKARTAGATDWRVVNDMEHLERVFEKRG